MAVPGSNAAVKMPFPSTNALRTDEKNQFFFWFKTDKAMIVVKPTNR